jgi:His/Glu/Gln/Arg/opine family amino acid ABC transporter permease subunit
VNYDFQWNVLWTPPYGGWIVQGILTTLRISVIAWLLAVVLGCFAGALRTVPSRPLRAIAAAYVEFFRNVPLLVWMFFWYFGAISLLPEGPRDWVNRNGGELLAAVFALGVYHGARFAEVIRAGIQSVPGGQLEAAISTGLGTWQAYRLVLIPIALRLIIPPATNETLNLLKNSSLALTISVAELTL